MSAAQEKYESWCCTNRSSDLDSCIQCCLNAVSSASPAFFVPVFHLLGKALCSRAVQSSSLQELDEGIEYLHTAITSEYSTPECLTSGVLADLASALHSRWHLDNQLDDLNASIQLRRLVLSVSSTYPCETQIASIAALSTALFLRFTHFPRMADLREVVELDRRALELSFDDRSRLRGLCTMAQSLLVQWEYDGESNHVESAINILREAVAIGRSMPNGALDYALTLNALSEAIQYQLSLSKEDIDECVSLDTLALTYVPKGHRERPLALAALATTILVRYTISFQNDDFVLYNALHDELRFILDAGYQDAATLADYWAFTQNIGPYDSERSALTFIFRQRLFIIRAETQPNEAVVNTPYARKIGPGVFLRRLVDPIGCGTLAMARFIDLQDASSEEQRKAKRGTIAWACRGKLIQASPKAVKPFTGSIREVEEEWLAYMPVKDDHPWAWAFYVRFPIQLWLDADDYNLKALQTAQKYAHRAWDIHPSNVPWGYQILGHIAHLYILQAQKECEDGATPLEALDQAIHYAEMASKTCPPSRRCEVELNAVDAYIMKHRLLPNDSSFLTCAIDICRKNCTDTDVDAWDRCTFADRLVDIAKEFGVHVLEALLLSFESVYDIISEKFNIHDAVEDINYLALSDALSTAAEQCFKVGAHEDVLRMLEKGRGMVWARLVQLQARRVKGGNQSGNDVAQLKLMLEAAADERAEEEEPRKRRLNIGCRQRRLDTDIQRLINRVQDRPTLLVENGRPFISPVLQGISPIVVLFAGVHRCDALMISGPTYTIQHIPLLECDRNTLNALVLKMHDALKDEGLTRGSPRFAVRIDEVGDAPQYPFEDVLADTWRIIVEPILKALQIKPSSCPPRLWWYPTGPFWQLPLHAAGLYQPDDGGVSSTSVMDYVVSSYLPPFNVTSTRILRKSLQPEQPQILAVYQSAFHSHSPLPNVEPEVRKIAEIASQRGIPITVLGKKDATINSISSALPKANIVHFALHGQQHVDAPMNSSLLLDNGTQLKLSHLMELNLPNADLVFLSACETATGDKKVSEEVIHIAAAMMFVGFRSAIGTMWSINDKDGPEVAGETYHNLLNKAMEPARALHESMNMMRRRQGVSAIRWAPFVHLGI
ncbi:CHAT domain-containing protein [Mucidula mucida]|nr:CHAT domain-containing protein [Mucidula mucida]